jgi:hypothetical protein
VFTLRKGAAVRQSLVAVVILVGILGVAGRAEADKAFVVGSSRFTVLDSSISAVDESIVNFGFVSQPVSSTKASAWRKQWGFSAKTSRAGLVFQFDCSDNTFRQMAELRYAGTKQIQSNLRVFDWETAELTSPAYDLGQYACDFVGYPDVVVVPDSNPTAPSTTSSPVVITSPPTTRPPSSSTAAPVKVGTVANPVPFGQFMPVGGWNVRVVQMNNDATAEVAAGNMFNDVPPSGQRWIGVVVEAYRTAPSPAAAAYGLRVSMLRDGRSVSAGSVSMRNEAAVNDIPQGASVLYATYFMVGSDLGDFNVTVADNSTYPTSIGVFRSR